MWKTPRRMAGSFFVNAKLEKINEDILYMGITVMFCFFIVINASKNKISKQEKVLS